MLIFRYAHRRYLQIRIKTTHDELGAMYLGWVSYRGQLATYGDVHEWSRSMRPMPIHRAPHDARGLTQLIATLIDDIETESADDLFTMSV